MLIYVPQLHWWSVFASTSLNSAFPQGWDDFGTKLSNSAVQVLFIHTKIKETVNSSMAEQDNTQIDGEIQNLVKKLDEGKI